MNKHELYEVKHRQYCIALLESEIAKALPKGLDINHLQTVNQTTMLTVHAEDRRHAIDIATILKPEPVTLVSRRTGTTFVPTIQYRPSNEHVLVTHDILPWWWQRSVNDAFLLWYSTIAGILVRVTVVVKNDGSKIREVQSAEPTETKSRLFRWTTNVFVDGAPNGDLRRFGNNVFFAICYREPGEGPDLWDFLGVDRPLDTPRYYGDEQ